MNQWFDIHSHILPGVDDGSVSMEQTRKMLKIAFNEGIGNLFATPHYGVGCVNKGLEELKEKYEIVNNAAKEIDADFQIILGNELYYSEDIIRHLRENKALTLGGTRYVLVEFRDNESFKNIKTGIHRLLIYGYLPILSHVETYSSLMDNYENIQKLVDLGAYMQMNTSSITEGIRSESRKRCKKLIKYNLVHFLGTNSHSDYKRTPCMRKGVNYLYRKYGKEMINRLLIENPKTLLRNEYIYN